MRTPIRVDSAHKVVELEEHHHLARNLNDLHRKVEKIDSRHTRRKTIINWVAQDRAGAGTAIYGIGSLEFRLSPRRHWRDCLSKVKISPVRKPRVQPLPFPAGQRFERKGREKRLGLPTGQEPSS